MAFSTMLSTMSSGMLKTFLIFALTLIGSLPLGMIVALLRKSRFAPVRGFIKGYISIMRGTPLMLQLLSSCLVWAAARVKETGREEKREGAGRCAGQGVQGGAQ